MFIVRATLYSKTHLKFRLLRSILWAPRHDKVAQIWVSDRVIFQNMPCHRSRHRYTHFMPPMPPISTSTMHHYKTTAITAATLNIHHKLMSLDSVGASYVPV